MNTDGPKNVSELFEFYYEFVKPLYSQIQTQNALPQETLFELNAAFDHISRFWHYKEPEAKAVEKAYGHLKRSCLDIFKLIFKEAVIQFEDLRKVDTSVIDNGEFDSRLVQLFTNLKKEAKIAREKEGEFKATGEVEHAFELWMPVYEKCMILETEFYSREGVNWAKQRHRKVNLTTFLISICAAFIGGMLVQYLLSLMN